MTVYVIKNRIYKFAKNSKFKRGFSFIRCKDSESSKGSTNSRNSGSSDVLEVQNADSKALSIFINLQGYIVQ